LIDTNDLQLQDSGFGLLPVIKKFALDLQKYSTEPQANFLKTPTTAECRRSLMSYRILSLN